MNISREQKIAVSVFLGLSLVAGALFTSDITESKNQVLSKFQANTDVVSPQRLQQKDRLAYGDKNADITLVEFSDFECPYCSRLHETFKQIVDESNGGIKWEYRHMPLPIHEHAKEAALTAFCVGDLKGSQTFWEFADILMKGQGGLTSEFFDKSARALGVDSSQLEACTQSAAAKAQVAEDTSVAQRLGGSGTPFTAIVYKDGSVKTVSGALPYAQWMPLLQIK